MTDTPETANGNSASDDAKPGEPPVSVRVASQFIKDLSFENPSADGMLKRPEGDPKLALEVNVTARHLEKITFESVIDFKARASIEETVIYNLEMVYGGLFEIRKMPRDAVEPFLLVNCPSLLFPFLRRLAADITRDGGFPPLLLDPIDFGQLYLNRKKQEEQAKTETPN